MALIEEKASEIGAKQIEIWSIHRVKMMIKLSLMNITTKESAFHTWYIPWENTAAR